MPNLLTFKIVTPDGVTYEDELERLTLPTINGEITVLANHTPLVTLLKPGEMIAHKSVGTSGLDSVEDNRKVYFAVSNGIVEIEHGSRVHILADTAERAENIDIERAEKARARAEEMLAQRDALDDIEFSRFQTILDRELARLKVGTRSRR